MLSLKLSGIQHGPTELAADFVERVKSLYQENQINLPQHQKDMMPFLVRTQNEFHNHIDGTERMRHAALTTMGRSPDEYVVSWNDLAAMAKGFDHARSVLQQQKVQSRELRFLTGNPIVASKTRSSSWKGAHQQVAAAVQEGDRGNSSDNWRHNASDRGRSPSKLPNQQERTKSLSPARSGDFRRDAGHTPRPQGLKKGDLNRGPLRTPQTNVAAAQEFEEAEDEEEEYDCDLHTGINWISVNFIHPADLADTAASHDDHPIVVCTIPAGRSAAVIAHGAASSRRPNQHRSVVVASPLAVVHIVLRTMLSQGLPTCLIHCETPSRMVVVLAMGMWNLTTGSMAVCSGCDKPFHLRCVLPPMATVPIGDWFCLSCRPDAGQIEELYDPDSPLQYCSTDFYVNPGLMDCLQSEGGDYAFPSGPEGRSLRRFLRQVRLHPTYPGWLQVRTRANTRMHMPWRTAPPLEYRWGVIRMYHDMLGHSGIAHTLRVLTRQVYWPNIKRDVTAYCMACLVCQQRKAVMYEADTREHTEIHGALKHIHVDLAGPIKTDLQVPVSIDELQDSQILGATVAVATLRKRSVKPAAQDEEPQVTARAKAKRAVSKPSSKVKIPTQQHWILLIIDYFTKAAEFVAVPSKSADVIAHALYDHWLCRYGAPSYVTSDNGTEFQGDFTAMLKRLGIVHITTAVRHPQSNGVCERLVGTLKRKLYSYCDGHPTHWISYLPRLRYAYMQELHAATKLSPFELLHGFLPNHPLPVSLNMTAAHELSVIDRSYMDHVMHRDLVDPDLCNHIENLRQRYMRMDASVLQNLMQAQDREIARFYRRKEEFHKSLPTARVGDYVFEIRESPRPMQSIADGPFQVVARNKDMATLRTGTTKWRHHTQGVRAQSGFPCTLPDPRPSSSQGIRSTSLLCFRGAPTQAHPCQLFSGSIF